MIPFKYGVVVSGKDFCGRRELIQTLQTYISSGQNVCIQGDRRIGKTSLVVETVRKTKSTRLLVMDILGLRTIDEFCARLVRQLVLLENSASFLGKVITSLPRLRPQISLDPFTNLPIVTIDKAAPVASSSLEELLELIGQVAKKRKMVVFFDEFQDILKIEKTPWLISTLRSKIQFQSDIPYIFAGSVRNSMDSIFTDSNSPFFKSAIPMSIGPIDQKEFSQFIKRKFNRDNRAVADDIIVKVFEMCGGISGDILQYCEAIWSVTSEGDSVDGEALQRALGLIFAREEQSYDIILSSLSLNQRNVLVGLAKNPNSRLNSSAFLKIAGISQPSSVTVAVNKLIDLRIVARQRHGVVFSNPFFARWLQRKW